MKHTQFRIWLGHMWQEHQDEILEITGHHCNYTAEDYFRRNKWWLKTQFKLQQKEATC